MTEEKKAAPAQPASQDDGIKLTWKSWVSLAYLIVAFSGVFAKSQGWEHAFDLMALVGKFGTMAGTAAGAKVNFMGAGGEGARAGFLLGLSLIPTVMFAQGMIEACQSMGALKAAAKLFQPILKPLLGLPGICGLAAITSLNSTDVGAIMTLGLLKDGYINDRERAIFSSFQYAGSGTIGNVIGAGAAMLPVSVLSVGVIIVLILVVKIIGANLVRVYTAMMDKKEKGAA